MAEQIGEFKFTGRIGDTSFYKSGEKYYARLAGGPDRKQIMEGAAFSRVRENISEFGACSRAGKLLRKSVQACLGIGDGNAYRRVAKLMSEIKNEDWVSERGKRNVSIALEGQGAKDKLRGFNFNIHAPLEKVLLKPATITKEGKFEIKGFLAERDLVFPEGANEVELRGAKVCIDFDKGSAVVNRYNEIVLRKNESCRTLVLDSEQKIAEQGHVLYLLQVVFRRVTDGESCAVEKGRRDALCIIEVDPLFNDTGKDLNVPETKEELLLSDTKLSLPDGVAIPLTSRNSDVFEHLFKRSKLFQRHAGKRRRKSSTFISMTSPELVHASGNFHKKMTAYVDEYATLLLTQNSDGTAIIQSMIIRQFVNFLWKQHMVTNIRQITVSMANSHFYAKYKQMNEEVISIVEIKSILKGFFIFIYDKYGIKNEKIMKGFDYKTKVQLPKSVLE